MAEFPTLDESITLTNQINAEKKSRAPALLNMLKSEDVTVYTSALDVIAKEAKKGNGALTYVLIDLVNNELSNPKLSRQEKRKLDDINNAIMETAEIKSDAVRKR